MSTTTKEYRTELLAELGAMDGAEQLRALTALREYVALVDAEAPPMNLVAHLAHHIGRAGTIGAATRLATFLGKVVPLHREAEDREQVEATLEAVEDLLQINRDRRKGSRGDGG